jgi:hypothetical protein
MRTAFATGDHPTFAGTFGWSGAEERTIDLSEGITKVFPGVELRKAESVSVAESDSLMGAVKKLLKTLDAGSADRVHEPPKQFKQGDKLTFGGVDILVIDANPKTYTLRLPSGDEAVVPATVDLTLASSDPSAFMLQVATTIKPLGSSLESLTSDNVLADDGKLTGALKALCDKNGDIPDEKLLAYLCANY